MNSNINFKRESHHRHTMCSNVHNTIKCKGSPNFMHFIYYHPFFFNCLIYCNNSRKNSHNKFNKIINF